MQLRTAGIAIGARGIHLGGLATPVRYNWPKQGRRKTAFHQGHRRGKFLRAPKTNTRESPPPFLKEC